MNMVLTNEQLMEIWRGSYTFEETADGYLLSYQFTKEQMDYFDRTKDFWGERCRYSNGKALCFSTNATELSFEYKLLLVSASMETFELMVDGVLLDMRDAEYAKSHSRISFTMPEGRKNVVIYMPCDVMLAIRNVTLNGDCIPAKRGEKVLWMGDSITQGIGTPYSSCTYVNTANRLLGYDVINQGIGGYRYDKGSLMPMPGYTPDKIVVAFGTNQFTEEQAVEDARAYYERLHELYGDIPVLCITPLWRTGETVYVEQLRQYGEAIRKVCAAYPNITVVDGWQLVPHLPEYFKDGLHPNALGATVYGLALVEQIRKNGF